ncbi:MAG: hypothetical protein KGI54_15010, partial [Pseudomonadota bacterium]|nr:hypothetical protein [Pseudomonadota bacterium]
PAPYYPPVATQLLPRAYLDGQIQALGVRLGWMKGHNCPCSYGYDMTGTPDPTCNTCHGRGYFWDAPCGTFTGLLTFMHGLGATPDEPGQVADSKYGIVRKGEPTLTVPYAEQDIWQNMTEFDAVVEIDANSRFRTTFIQGETSIIPYQQGLSIDSVYIFNRTTQTTFLATSGQYTVSGASVLLNGFDDGTAYSVEFQASPVYIVFRHAGGLPHARPFAAGQSQISRRFRVESMDMWLRARGQNVTNTSNPSTSPNSLL